jgi:rubrerythrin
MGKANEPKALTEYINGLGNLESNTNLLYITIADKIDEPLVKSLFQEIAVDSHKHSLILKGISESISQPENDLKECAEKIGESWGMMAKIQKEIDKMDKLDSENLHWLSEKLVFFESIMGEEYYVFVQLTTLQILVKEIKQKYNINLEQTKSIFTNIINDENHHREILETIRELTAKRERETDISPAVKYQDPRCLDQAHGSCKIKS